MSDQQRPDQPPEGERQPPPPPPEPPPWPTLGANWKEAPPPPPPPPPRTAAPPRPETAEQQWWQEPPQTSWGQPPVQNWGQPPVPAPWNHPEAPRYPGARIPDSEARNWAMAAHLSPLLAVFIGLPFLGPMVVWLAKREDHPYIAEQGREALNFNLSMFIYMIGAFFSIILFVGFLLVPVLVVTWLVLTIIGAVKAANGEPYRYPLTMRMVS